MTKLTVNLRCIFYLLTSAFMLVKNEKSYISSTK